MPDLTRAGSAIIQPTNPYSLADLEMGKFLINNGTTSINIGFGTTAVGTANALPVTLNTLIAGEDLTNNVMKVEQRFSYAYSAAVGTTVIKGSAGFLHGIAVTGTTAGGAITIYDNASGTSATVIGQIATTSPAQFYTYDVNTLNGIVVANVGTQIYTVSFR